EVGGDRGTHLPLRELVVERCAALATHRRFVVRKRSPPRGFLGRGGLGHRFFLSRGHGLVPFPAAAHFRQLVVIVVLGRAALLAGRLLDLHLLAHPVGEVVVVLGLLGLDVQVLGLDEVLQLGARHVMHACPVVVVLVARLARGRVIPGRPAVGAAVVVPVATALLAPGLLVTGPAVVTLALPGGGALLALVIVTPPLAAAERLGDVVVVEVDELVRDGVLHRELEPLVVAQGRGAAGHGDT